MRRSSCYRRAIAPVVTDLAARYVNVSVAADNQAIVDGAATVILAVRPQDAETALAGLAFSPDQTVISLMAGLQVGRVQALVKPAATVVRRHPASRRCLAGWADARSTRRTLLHLPCLTGWGRPYRLDDEGAFDAFAAASSTVAAHFAYLDTVSGWLAARKIPAEAAQRYVASVFASLAESLRSGSSDFAASARDHATPGGYNELFMGLLKEAGVFETVGSGLDCVYERLTQR